MALDAYRQKRDFRGTPEPRGKVLHRKTHRLSFVVQKHAASHLHYDFRLELNGVLLSWAVPKGPSLDPADKRLAIHVEDHPLEYGGFEGLIPPKQYGSGTVMVWDGGTWTPKEDPALGYQKGRLKFELDGQKLKGGWMLVRGHGSTYGGGKADNWLLIKERDEFALRGDAGHIVDHAPNSILSGRTMDEIALAGDHVWHSNKSARANVQAGAVNREAVAKTERLDRPLTGPKTRATRESQRTAKTIDLADIPGAKRARCPAIVSPMLATLVTAIPTGNEWLHEMKYDGYRMLCRRTNGSVHIYSRNGRDWTDAVRGLAADVQKLTLESAWLDGEVAVVTDEGRTSFQALQNALDASSSVQLTYFVFDLLYLDGYDLRDVELIERKRILENVLSSAPAGVRYSDHVLGSGEEFLSQACRLNLEGAISKRADSIYAGARTRTWVKVKCSHRQELVIGGFTDPKGSRAGLGALLLGVYEPDGSLHYAGKVGTGFDQHNLGALRKKLEGMKQDSAPFDNPPKGFEAKGVHWVKPELVAEIAFAEWTASGTLRQASFQGLRSDKRAAEVVRERPQSVAAADAQKRKPGSKRRRTARVEETPATESAAATVASVALSNPDKLLYPDAKLSKLALARYYEAVGDWIAPHLKNRPLSLLRCPDGWQGECFYQKHADKSVHAAVGRVTVPEGTGHATYMMVNSVSGIIGLVQLGVLELHPWGARAPKLERPDRLVFDFDPDETATWKELADAVSLLRSLLGELGLTGFLKTTGGKGLHVVLPINPTLSWDQAKRFTKAVAELMVTTFPDRFVATASKAKRKGRIFIDYLRNAQGATAVSAFSLRARANAPVATPIEWEELDRDVRFDYFNLRSVPERLERLKDDPWANFFALKQSISVKILKRLGVES